MLSIIKLQFQFAKCCIIHSCSQNWCWCTNRSQMVYFCTWDWRVWQEINLWKGAILTFLKFIFMSSTVMRPFISRLQMLPRSHLSTIVDIYRWALWQVKRPFWPSNIFCQFTKVIDCRVKLWLCDPDLYPDADFIHTVPRGKLHAFTMLQVVCLMSLWTLRTSHWGMHSYPSSIVSSWSKFCLTILFFFSSILFILSVISSSTVKPTISDMLVSDCCINLLTGLIVSTWKWLGAGIMFPLLIMALLPIRNYVATQLVDRQYLALLDAD